MAKDGESESIQNQKSLLISYAKEQDWEIFNIYSDSDYSGADNKRPEFTKLIEDARKKRFDIILCKTQSRFTRDMELVERYINNEFAENGIRFIALLDNIDTNTKGNRKSRQINGLINQWYLEDLSDNIRAVLEQKRRNGQYIGSFALYGYKKSEHNKNALLIDTEAAQNVRNIFEMYLLGFSRKRIADYLNKNNIKSPAQYKQFCGESYSNGSNSDNKWSAVAVGRILSNPMYTGVMTQGKRRKVSYKSHKVVSVPRNEWITVQNTHQAIIDKISFDRVQELLGQRRHSTGRGDKYILRGKLYCGSCKGKMEKYSRTYKGKTTFYLRCGSYGQSKDTCTPHSIRLDRVINAVEEYMGCEMSEENVEHFVHRIEIGEKTEDKAEQIININ